MSGDDFKMTATEMARLSDWLKSKGLTAEEVLQCIHYIAGTAEVPVNEKSGS